MLTKPRWLLHLEGASILWLASYFYYSRHFSGWLFALLFLAPDLFMLGYVKNVRWGSVAYNFAHTLTLPVVLLALAFLLPAYQCFPYALIAHIGFDRMLGYGLKYPTFFKDTHLQHV
ncbi:MAG TPA: DUF4260 family protein [Candidatus Acidoferrum sp.]|jgi:hypothetical protein